MSCCVNERVCQTAGTNTCGQTCVAMIVGRPVEEVILRAGAGRTRGRDLSHALRAYGFQLLRLRRATLSRVPSNVLALVTLHWPDSRQTHWIIADHGELIDPAGSVEDWPE